MRILFFITALTLVVQSCRNDNDSQSIDLKSVYNNSLNDTVKFKVTELIKKDDFNQFMFIPPYTHIDRLEKSIGIDIQSLKETGIERRDDVYLLSIFSDGKLIDYYYVNYQFIYFSDSIDLKMFNKEEIFRIVRKSDDDYLIID